MRRKFPFKLRCIINLGSLGAATPRGPAARAEAPLFYNREAEGLTAVGLYVIMNLYGGNHETHFLTIQHRFFSPP